MKQFQPTLPARGATAQRRPERRHRRISTHAPRTGSDQIKPGTVRQNGDFNPRSPHGERRRFSSLSLRPMYISTHAPRTGSDLMALVERLKIRLFQPTLPARGATRTKKSYKNGIEFQPTLPARGATLPSTTSSGFALFQPTLPARGATILQQTPKSSKRYFNPRSPHGERRRRSAASGYQRDFNPRSPHGERLFQPRLSRG